MRWAFVANTSYYNAGAMYSNGSGGGNSSPQMRNVSFRNNTTLLGSGGAMFSYAYGAGSVSAPVLDGVTFAENHSAENGGAMLHMGDAGGTSSPVLTNVTLSGNSATGSGGGMFNYANGNGSASTSAPVLTNVTFSGNQAATKAARS